MSESISDRVAEAKRLLDAGRAADAVALLRACVEEDPDNAEAVLALGVAHARAGDTGLAVVTIQRAQMLRPNDPAIAYNLGVALSRTGSRDEARAAFRQALQIEPTHARARDALARLEAEAAAGVDLADPVVAESPAAARDLQVLQPASVATTQQADAEAATPALEPPTLGLAKSVLLGGAWGIVHGQLWTVLYVFWGLVWGGRMPALGAIIALLVLLGVIFGFCGLVTGVAVGAARRGVPSPAAIGGAVGLLLMYLEYRIEARATVLINIIFWFFTGQWVASGIAGRLRAAAERAGAQTWRA